MTRTVKKKKNRLQSTSNEEDAPLFLDSLEDQHHRELCLRSLIPTKKPKQWSLQHQKKAFAVVVVVVVVAVVEFMESISIPPFR